MYDNVIHALIGVLSVLWSQDASSLIYVFPTKARNNSQAHPVKLHTWNDQPPDRSTLEIKAHQVWLRSGNIPFLRFLLGDDKSGEALFCSDLQEALEARDYFLRVDHIQADTIGTYGFLVGSYMKSFNVDHYNTLLSTNPKFTACPGSVIKNNVQLIAGEKMAQKSLRHMSNVMPLNAKPQ